MKDAWPSGSRKRKSRAPNRSTPGPQSSTCIPAGHEQELQSKAVESTIFVNPFPKAQRADEPSVLAESSPNPPSSEFVHLSHSAIHSPKSLQQDSQNQTAGMELSKQHSTEVAHNGPAKSPSERRRIVTIKVPQRNNGNGGSGDRIASQQEKAPPRTKELDTLSREPIQNSGTNNLNRMTTYETTLGTEHISSSPSTSSQLKQNVDVIAKTKLATIQMKGKPICSFCHKECSDMDSFREHVRVWCQYGPDLRVTESYVPLPSFQETTADRTRYHSHYLSDEQPPPEGMIRYAEQPLNLQGYFEHHETPISDSVREADNDSLVYGADTQCIPFKVIFFPSCQRCRVLGKDCNGETPCDNCTSIGKGCKYNIDREVDGRGMEKRRFFEACNQCLDSKISCNGDGKYPCGGCIDGKKKCIYSVEAMIDADLAMENIALLSQRVKELELATQRGLIAFISKSCSGVRRGIAKFYGGISKAPRYGKQKRRLY
ncbi:hypothetical protein FOXG_22720 [Fusarium oxysporum f. sp. lycopersici 4287]|uniref:Zn(2)-C6 fungal-type domain-containing protein n=1 Tax=Fusarium oxysporum f. sp. lycopersici (strain 4287 / CBS 123668 / FGSC 9935 / NRRL 34936) TaxID=426428 RepID=A0A0J9W9K2_FUSO4|nr:hypothetical protein FOXG_22720 [Fusarium oxysporum f. sp. lycopersici 4287]EWZ78916.1 hypothetical protein FOWG_16921 [Fusarium oxysporum f. sp. lycopersici MN25]KNB20019.1 hypothetical protein FOXG_22720 [Fusarium oxysporum f. sp. lycopersici 4287]